MTRIYSLPTTQPAQEHTYTPQQDELRKVRHRLSLCAARVGMKGVGVATTIAQVEDVLEALRKLAEEAQA